MIDREKQIEMLRDSIQSTETFILRHEEKIQTWEQRLEAFSSESDDAPGMLARGQMEFLVLNALGIVQERRRNIEGLKAELAWMLQQTPPQPSEEVAIPPGAMAGLPPGAFRIPAMYENPSIQGMFNSALAMLKSQRAPAQIVNYDVCYSSTDLDALRGGVKAFLAEGWRPFGGMQVRGNGMVGIEFFQVVVKYAASVDLTTQCPLCLWDAPLPGFKGVCPNCHEDTTEALAAIRNSSK